MENGVVAGYPMVDIKAIVLDGKYHEVDSSELAFKIAGSMAFKEACEKADPVMLETIMEVEVVTPQDSRHGKSRRRAGHRGSRAAGDDVRLRDAAALDDAGPRNLHDAIRRV